MGRGTYEKVLTFGEWPYTGKTVIVLSTTLAAEDLNIVIAPTLDDVLHALESGAARQVYVDGGRVIQTFLRRLGRCTRLGGLLCTRSLRRRGR